MADRPERFNMVDGVQIAWTDTDWDDWEDRQAEMDLDFSSVRSHRNSILADSDWTQLSDAPLGVHAADADEPITTAEWATYRQELRDYPAQSDRVSTLPEWPTPPE